MQNKKRFRLSLTQKRRLQGTAFLLPLTLGIALIFIPAMVLSFRLSISDLKILGTEGYELTYNHFSNYQYALTKDPNFTGMLLNTFFSPDAVWIQVLTVIIFSLFIAVILNQKFHGRQKRHKRRGSIL